MKENKNIERLFQEKFKDFEAIPPQESWDLIASRLQEKKKKKRVIPIWFRYSGIAASLFLIGTLIWNYSFTNNPNEHLTNPENTIVDKDGNIINKKDANSSIDNAVVYDAKLNQQKSDANLENSTKNENQLENASTFYKNSIDSKIQKKSSKTNAVVNNNTIQKYTDPKVVSKRKSNKNYNNQLNVFKNSNDGVVDIAQKNNSKRKSKYKTNKKNSSVTENEILLENNLIVNDDKKGKTSVNKENIDAFFEKELSNSTIVNNNHNDSIANKTILSNGVVENEIITQDSTLVAEVAVEPNPLEELLKEKEDGKNEDEKEEKRSKWAISTNASPVYFNSLAEGSSIDDQFNSNSKNYTTTLSYGIAGSYAINDKLSLKTGVNSINLSYNTNDVLFESRMREVDNNIPTISRNANASNMVFSSKNGTINEISGDVENVIIDNNIGSLKQNISYIEVPLELSYKLIDKKFGVEIIGGMSTLFLNQNNISLVTNGLEMEVGSANNLNNIHFSSNVGLGFKYSFWKSFNANFQPMFKYQINTFNQNSGNFKPYFIGLYSGISFSF
ncbi:hypothetical protein [Flavobacterium cyclinae]|uniref:hypothetical protein n=1 Tax=Flavobacterium cyclinae TaxID=2895947 RepID=UPI001E517FA4|nr:hypothetical protein [Flavobacterium cyclinae]UGS21150.1 hypothetical protein LOS86_00560 [Flavobacterium cyclinae]